MPIDNDSLSPNSSTAWKLAMVSRSSQYITGEQKKLRLLLRMQIKYIFGTTWFDNAYRTH